MAQYNGWTNKPTWLVNLWITSDENQAAFWKSEVENALFMNEGDKTAAAEDVAYQLESMIEHPDEETGLYADLLSYALALVNWREVAEHLVDDHYEEWLGR